MILKTRCPVSFRRYLGRWLLCSLFALLFVCFSQAGFARFSINGFDQNSLCAIEQAHQGKAFILVLWSIDCPPCLQELSLLARMQGAGLAGRVILVATDDQDYREAIAERLTQEALFDYEHWHFNDVIPERLRYAIDPAWYGELPRAYFYDAQGQRVSHSGLLSEALLREWLTIHARSAQYAPQ